MCLLDHTFYSDTYGAEYELSLSAWGEGILCESGLLDIQKPDEIISKFTKKYHRYPKDITLLIKDSIAAGYDFGFTGVDPKFLAKLKTLKELILPDSITSIDITPEIDKIFKDNNTLIRGSFDSFAERLASADGLNFRPADFVFASFEDKRFHENTTLSLIFKRNGNVEIKESSSSPGTSAGNTFGGSFTHSLCRDFCKTKTAEQIAGQFSQYVYQVIMEDGRLAAFMEKARLCDYYMGKN